MVACLPSAVLRLITGVFPKDSLFIFFFSLLFPAIKLRDQYGLGAPGRRAV